MPAPSTPPRSASWWEWVQAALIAANLAWTTLCLGGYRPDTMIVSAALTLMALVLHCALRAWSAARWHAAGWLFVPFLAYALANVLWLTPVRWLGWRDWLGWAQMIAVFWIVVNDLGSRGPRKLLFLTLLALAVTGTALACYQRFAQPAWLMLGAGQMEQFLARSSGSFAVPNSFAALLVLLLPATALPLWRRSATAVHRVGFGYAAALLLLGLGLTISRGAWLGLIAATVLWPLAMAGRAWRRRVGISLLVAGTACAGLVGVYFSVPAARERLGYLVRDLGEKSRPTLWRAAGQIAREHPVTGGGAGSYATLFEQKRPEHYQKEPQWAHCDYLNTLSDYGVVGFSLFFGACGLAAWRCGRRQAPPPGPGHPAASLASIEHDWLDSRAFTVALAIGLLAFGFHLCVDFHLKIPALAMAAATLAGLGVVRAWPRSDRVTAADSAGGGSPSRLARPLPRVAAGLVAVALVVFAVMKVLPFYRAEAERRLHRLALDALAEAPRLDTERSAITRAAREALAHALTLDPANAQAWADRAYTAAILGHDEPARVRDLGIEAEVDARRALAHSRVVPEFWLRLGVALDMQGKWSEAGIAFAEALHLAPTSATNWFYYAYHLSLQRVSLPLARSAVATSLRLDPSRPEAESLRQNLAARQ